MKITTKEKGKTPSRNIKLNRMYFAGTLLAIAATATSLDTWGWGMDDDHISGGNNPNLTYQFWNVPPNNSLLPGWTALNQPPATLVDGQTYTVRPIEAALMNNMHSPLTMVLSSDGRVVCCGKETSNMDFGGSSPYPNVANGKSFFLKYPTGQKVENVIHLADTVHGLSRQGAAVLADGRVIVWGLDPATGLARPVTVVKDASGNDITNAKQVEVNTYGTYILTAEGKVLSFGKVYGGVHPLGRLPNNDAHIPKEVQFGLIPSYATKGPWGIKQIATGLGFVALLDKCGNVYTFGEVAQGQLGIPGAQYQPFAQWAYGLGKPGFLGLAKQIACSQTAGFALLSNGRVIGWGENANLCGQLGYAGGILIQPTPVPVPDPNCLTPLYDIVEIRTTLWGPYCLSADGTVWALGQASLYSIPGKPWLTAVDVPWQLKFLGQNSTNKNFINTGVTVPLPGLMIRNTSRPWAMGEEGKSLGLATYQTTNVLKPTAVFNSPDPTLGFRMIRTDRFSNQGTKKSYAVAIDYKGDIWTVGNQSATSPCLGNNLAGNLQTKFKQISYASYSSSKAIQVESYGGTTIALLATGDLVGWGANPTRSAVPVPAAVPVGIPLGGIKGHIIKIAVGRDVTYALLANGQVLYSGRGFDYSGSTVQFPVFTNTTTSPWHQLQITPGAVFKNDPDADPDILFSYVLTAIDIAATDDSFAAVLADGNVYTYGDNSVKQLGTASTTSPSIGTINATRLSNVKAVSFAGSRPVVGARWTTCFALTADGHVKSWGSNAKGQLGRNSSLANDHDIQDVTLAGTSLANVKQIGAGAASGFALRADGNMFSWGNNAFGQLGINSTSNAKEARALVGNKSQYWRFGVGSNGITTYLLDANN